MSIILKAILTIANYFSTNTNPTISFMKEIGKLYMKKVINHWNIHIVSGKFIYFILTANLG